MLMLVALSAAAVMTASMATGAVLRVLPSVLMVGVRARWSDHVMALAPDGMSAMVPDAQRGPGWGRVYGMHSLQTTGVLKEMQGMIVSHVEAIAYSLQSMPAAFTLNMTKMCTVLCHAIRNLSSPLSECLCRVSLVLQEFWRLSHRHGS